MFVVVILAHLLKLIHFFVNSSKYHFLALVNFIYLFSAHAPRGNQLRLTGSACIKKKILYIYLSVLADDSSIPTKTDDLSDE